MNELSPRFRLATLVVCGAAALFSMGACVSDTASAEQVTALATMPPPAGRATADFAAVQAIFDENCVVCHQTDVAEESLILESGKAYARIVGKPSVRAPMALIDPGSPERSYLLHKITNTQMRVGGSGARMPLGGELDAQSIATIKAWISAGAKRD